MEEDEIPLFEEEEEVEEPDTIDPIEDDLSGWSGLSNIQSHIL